MTSPFDTIRLLAIALFVVVAVAHPSDAHPSDAHPSDAHPSDAHRCPPGCFCYTDTSRPVVKCRHLSTLPDALPRLARVLILDGVPLGGLTASTVAVKDLEAFQCVGCSLQRVDLDAFSGLQSLKIVDLSDNDIVGLTAAHFTDLADLEALDLAGNAHVDCAALKKGLPKVAVNCDPKQHPKGQSHAARMTSSALKGQRAGGKYDVTKTHAKRQAEVAVNTLPETLTTSTMPTPEGQQECISYAWKVVAIVFIVLWSVSCFCNLLKCCCEFCGSKERAVKRPPGGNTVYQMTTTELDDRYT